MRLVAFCAGVVAAAACTAPALAMEFPAPQEAIADPWRVERERPATVSDLLTRLDRDARFGAVAPAFEGDDRWAGYDPARTVSSTWACTSSRMVAVASGPTCVAGSNGSPTRRADIRDTNASSNSS